MFSNIIIFANLNKNVPYNCREIMKIRDPAPIKQTRNVTKDFKVNDRTSLYSKRTFFFLSFL